MISTSLLRTRWAAIGAAVAVTLGAGGLAVVDAAVTTGERTVFVAITPCRLVDTRPTSTVGPKSSPVGPGETHTVTAHGTTGDCTIPTDAVALSLNVTAIGATLPTFLTVWPAGATQPEASSLNPSPGQPPTPNAVTTDLSTDGRFSIFNLQGSVDVLVDVNGYYADHNHDDRYYTKAESDAAFVQSGAAAAPPSNQTRWIGCIGPSMNTPDDEDDTSSPTTNDSSYITSATSGAEFFCTLDLPQGASVNGFRALLRDTGPTGAGQGISRCFFYAMPLSGPDAGIQDNLGNTAVGTGLVGSNGVETPFLIEDPMPAFVVDNDSFVYFIKCDIFSGGSTLPTQLGIYAAQVRYVAAAVPGTNN